MANKVYDYSLYTWQDFSLTYDNFTPEALAKAWGLPVQDIVVSGSKSWIGTGWYIDSSFSVIINNLDSRFWLLKASQTSGQNIHPTQQSGNSIILTFPSCIINELSLGEQTAYKVYNSYRWYNQQLKQNESYWPWGCVLAKMVNYNSDMVRIETNTHSTSLKKYSIPKFCTDGRSISGYGWYREANTSEILADNTGYQASTQLSPFNTNKPEKMLFLPEQLRSPNFTILYNGWDWTQGDYIEPKCEVYNNDVLLDDQIAYTLQEGDVLVRYQVTDEALHNYSSEKILSTGPFQFTDTAGNPDPQYRSIPSDLFYVTIRDDLEWLVELHIEPKSELAVEYDIQFDPITMSIYQNNTFQRIDTTHKNYQLFLTPILYSTWKYQNKQTESINIFNKTLADLPLEKWVLYQDDLSYSLSVKIQQVPHLLTVHDWQTFTINTIPEIILDISAGLPKPSGWGSNYSALYICPPVWYFSACKFLNNVSFPIFIRQTIDSETHAFTNDTYTTEVAFKIGLTESKNIYSPLSSYPGHMQRGVREYSCYVVWHFQVLPQEI